MRYQKNENMDEIDKLLYDYFKDKEIPKETIDIIKSEPHKPKIKRNITKIVAIIILGFVFTTGIVFAKDITNFFITIFSLNNVNLKNDGIINAIENEDYVQNIDMDYIMLGEKYGIKVDYLLMDDINLYIVFNIHSEKEIKENYRISILDLKIFDTNNNLIYNSNNNIIDNSQIITIAGWKKIDNKIKNEKRELLFLVSNGIPKATRLKIEFSKVILYDDNNPNVNQEEIECNCSFNIDIIDKFIDRKIYQFSNINNNEYQTKKIITNNTGTYLVLETEDPKVDFTIQYEGKKYLSTKRLLGINIKGNYEFILQYNLNINQLNENPTLILEDTIGNSITINKECVLK